MKDQGSSGKDSILMITSWPNVGKPVSQHAFKKVPLIGSLGKLRMDPPWLLSKCGWPCHQMTQTDIKGPSQYMPKWFTTFCNVTLMTPLSWSLAKKIQGFNEGSLTPWDIFRKAWNLTLQCSRLYSEQMLEGFFVNVFDRSIRSNMRRWWVNNQAGTLGDLANQPDSPLNLQEGRRKIAEKEVRWTEVVRRLIKDPKGRGKARCATVVVNHGTPFSPSKNRLLSWKTWAQVMSKDASALSSKEYESDSSFADSRTYCRVCYSSYHKNLKSHHLKENFNFVKARNWIYEAGLGIEGDHRRQTPCPAVHYSAPSHDHQSSPRISNRNFSTKRHNSKYVLILGLRIKLSGFECPH